VHKREREVEQIVQHTHGYIAVCVCVFFCAATVRRPPLFLYRFIIIYDTKHQEPFFLSLIFVAGVFFNV
jgi:hypothetical protein